MKKTILNLFFSTVCYVAIYGQDTKPFIAQGDAKYYDFWEGNWYQVINDKVDTSATWFKVKKSVHPAAWSEEWRMVIDSTTTLHATAIRAWDKTNNKWMYTWVSDNGLYQVWEGKKIGENWYIYKEFEINGDKFLSRQAWIPIEKNKLMRISERSHDNGTTWVFRFKEFYIRQ
jgi:hypothetical protein